MQAHTQAHTYVQMHNMKFLIFCCWLYIYWAGARYAYHNGAGRVLVLDSSSMLGLFISYALGSQLTVAYNASYHGARLMGRRLDEPSDLYQSLPCSV